ncbi:zinc finger protein 436-like [Thunnus thynnus]|uniref:zinc finger protein 436-like n=1 Tax=Thunnus thynnus TaxID=8237 RepID=UPI003527AAF9
MSELQLLRTLVTEKLTAAAEEILALLERVMLEREEELIRRYRAADMTLSPATDPPLSRGGHTGSQQLDGGELQEQLPLQQPDEQPELPTIKQEQDGEEKEWTSPGVQDEAPQMEFIYSLQCKSEQPQVDCAPSEEALKVELRDGDVLPSTSSELTVAPPLQWDLPADPPAAATQSEDAGGNTTSRSCKVCGMMFSYRGSLMNHVEVHADDEHCLCGVCGKLLPDRESLLQHLQTHVKTHVCQVCGKTFRRHVELAVHTRCHTGEKPFSCKVCGKCFSRKGNMEIHMRTHTGEKPYRCGVCGKCFNITSSMIRHSRTHSGEKPYTCNFCFKGFTNSSDMKIHMRTHTGEKPYTCLVCGKGFPLSTPLKYHMRRHTEELLQRRVHTATPHEDSQRESFLMKHSR